MVLDRLPEAVVTEQATSWPMSRNLSASPVSRLPPGASFYGLARPAAVCHEAESLGVRQSCDHGQVDGGDAGRGGESFLEGGDDVGPHGGQPPQGAVPFAERFEGGAPAGGDSGCLVGQRVDALVAHHDGQDRAVDSDGASRGGVVGEGVVDHLADCLLIVGKEGLPPLIGLGAQLAVDAVQAGLFGGQVGRGVFFGPSPRCRPLGTGEYTQPSEVVGLGFRQGPGQAELRRSRYHRRLDQREGLQVDTGRLPPQLLQLRDRSIPFRLLLSPLGLPASTVQLCRRGGEGPRPEPGRGGPASRAAPASAGGEGDGDAEWSDAEAESGSHGSSTSGRCGGWVVRGWPHAGASVRAPKYGPGYLDDLPQTSALAVVIVCPLPGIRPAGSVRRLLAHRGRESTAVRAGGGHSRRGRLRPALPGVRVQHVPRAGASLLPGYAQVDRYPVTQTVQDRVVDGGLGPGHGSGEGNGAAVAQRRPPFVRLGPGSALARSL